MIQKGIKHNNMNIPGFTAKASLGSIMSFYPDKSIFSNSGRVAVVPMLDEICGNCELVGGLGGIRGVGMKSCCRKVWKYDPITKRYAPTWDCWFESCSPVAQPNRWLTF
jgi:hypothetical protein